MAKNSILAILLLVLAVGNLSGCAAIFTRSPVTGFLYTDVESGVAATSNQSGNRLGEACASSILGLVAFGDASIETARRNGGITTITSVDQGSSIYLGVYSRVCTYVRGR